MSCTDSTSARTEASDVGNGAASFNTGTMIEIEAALLIARWSRGSAAAGSVERRLIVDIFLFIEQRDFGIDLARARERLRAPEFPGNLFENGGRRAAKPDQVIAAIAREITQPADVELEHAWRVRRKVRPCWESAAAKSWDMTG
jgi:hypothetical protein